MSLQLEIIVVVPDGFLMVVKLKSEFCFRFFNIMPLIALVAEKQIYKILTITIQNQRFEYYMSAGGGGETAISDMSTDLASGLIPGHIP